MDEIGVSLAKQLYQLSETVASTCLWSAISATALRMKLSRLTGRVQDSGRTRERRGGLGVYVIDA